MSGGRRRVGIVGAAAGLTAAGIGLGLTAHRYAVARVRRRPARTEKGDEQPLGLTGSRSLTVSDAREPAARSAHREYPASEWAAGSPAENPSGYGSQMDLAAGFSAGTRCEQERPVTADDGVPLHVEVDGLAGADDELTIVFCHGYALHQGCWHYQRRDLRDLGRLVFWDHRGHGRSGPSGRERSTIDQLGRDLHAVLRATVPAGAPVVLVGHSMGGMTIMALADQHPELFGDQVRGVGLICTSAGKLTELTYGLPAASARAVRRAASGVVDVLGRRASLVEPARRVGRELGVPLVRRYGFSRDDVDPAAVRLVNEMIADTPVDVVADFYHAVMGHDKITVLDVLSRVDTLVVAGADDKLAPAEHGRAIAAAIPSARLWVIPRAGHVAMLEWPEVVNDALRGLVRRVRRGLAEERTA